MDNDDRFVIICVLYTLIPIILLKLDVYITFGMLIISIKVHNIMKANGTVLDMVPYDMYD